MKIFNIPNLLSLSRIILVPFFAYFFWIGQYKRALVCFFVAGFTDLLDGVMARLLNERSVLGTFLDPAADKFLMTVTFIILAVQGTVPTWLTTMVIARDVYIVGGFTYLHLKGIRVSVRPTKLSKLNTFCQLTVVFLAFTIVYLGADHPDFPASYLAFLEQTFWVAVSAVVCMTITTGIQYTGIGWNIYKGRAPYADLSAQKSQVGRQ